MPAHIVPPDPSASLEEWQSYRASLDELEARLLVSHPDLSWLDGLRSFKAGADAGIRGHLKRGGPGPALADEPGPLRRRTGQRAAAKTMQDNWDGS